MDGLAVFQDCIVAEAGGRSAVVDAEDQQHEVARVDLREHPGPVSRVISEARFPGVADVFDRDLCRVEELGEGRAPANHGLTVPARAGVLGGGISADENRRYGRGGGGRIRGGEAKQGGDREEDEESERAGESFHGRG